MASSKNGTPPTENRSEEEEEDDYDRALGQLQRLAMFYQSRGFTEKAEQLFESLRLMRKQAERFKNRKPADDDRQIQE